MNSIFTFIENNFFVLWLSAVAYTIIIYGYLFYKKRQKGNIFPDISTQNILHQESSASGRMLMDWRRIGGANNCLKVTITEEEIWTSLVFPFNLMPDLYGLENRIYRNNIENVEEKTSFFLGKTFIITYKDMEGKTQKIEIASKNPDNFKKSLELSR